MLNKIITFLLSIFYRVEKDTPLSIRAWDNKTNVKPKSDSYEDKAHLRISPITKSGKSKRTISKEKVVTQIKNNIYFLETLIAEFEPHKEYKEYLLKLQDLKEQSQGCLRILFRIKEEAPYYLNTLKTVYSHTKNIAELMEDN